MSLITVKRSELKQALAIVKRTVGAHRTMPILGNVLLSSGGAGILQVSTTDLELGSLVRLSATGCEGMESLCVPLKAFGAVVRASKDASVSIEGLEGFKVRVGGATLAGNDPLEYPTMPSADDHETAERFDAPTLAQALREVSYAASRDETRYNLNGVFFEDTGDAVTFTATDGHRLAQSRIGAHVLEGCGHSNHKLESERGGWIVPLGFVSALEALIGKRKPHASGVRIGNLGGNLSAVVGNVTLVCRLIDGDYPNYRQVIPQRNGRVAHFDRAELLGAVESVDVVASQSKTHAVRIRFTAEGIHLKASDPDSGEASARCSADVSEQTHPYPRIGLNARYLRGMLENVEGERLAFYLPEPEKNRQTKAMECTGPISFGATDSPNLGVIMPMRL